MSMRNPSHPGELIRESIQAKGWTVAQCAERLSVTRNTLSRLLNGHAGTDARELRTSASSAERNGGVSLTQVGGHAGALVFMIGTLAGMAGGFWEEA